MPEDGTYADFQKAQGGETRGREKAVRGIKKEDAPLIEGHRIYLNFVRLHMAWDGKTPQI